MTTNGRPSLTYCAYPDRDLWKSSLTWQSSSTIDFKRSLESKRQFHGFSETWRSVALKMREIVHLQAGQCGNQIGAKVSNKRFRIFIQKYTFVWLKQRRQNFRTTRRSIVVTLLQYKNIPHLFVVLGSHFRWTRNQWVGGLQRRLWFAAWEN